MTLAPWRMANAAIYLNPEAYNTQVNVLMGRHSAGESFLRGYIRHSTAKEFWFWNVAGAPILKMDEFVNKVQKPAKPVKWIQRNAREYLREAGVAYVRRAGVLYSWGLRHLILVAPILACLLHPLAGPVAAVLVVIVLLRFDRIGAE